MALTVVKYNRKSVGATSSTTGTPGILMKSKVQSQSAIKHQAATSSSTPAAADNKVCSKLFVIHLFVISFFPFFVCVPLWHFGFLLKIDYSPHLLLLAIVRQGCYVMHGMPTFLAEQEEVNKIKWQNRSKIHFMGAWGIWKKYMQLC